MDILFLCVGGVCLAEGIDLFTGDDFLMFVGSSNKKDYDLDKIYAVEKWVFLVDALCSFIIGLNRFPAEAVWTAMGVFALTLVIRVYVFKSRKFRTN